MSLNSMFFEWDPSISPRNKEKHGIDFEAAKVLWEDPDRLEIFAPYMKKKNLAWNNEEFDDRPDRAEDVHQLIDISRAPVAKPGK